MPLMSGTVEGTSQQESDDFVPCSISEREVDCWIEDVEMPAVFPDPCAVGNSSVSTIYEVSSHAVTHTEVNDTYESLADHSACRNDSNYDDSIADPDFEPGSTEATTDTDTDKDSDDINSQKQNSLKQSIKNSIVIEKDHNSSDSELEAVNVSVSTDTTRSSVNDVNSRK